MAAVLLQPTVIYSVVVINVVVPEMTVVYVPMEVVCSADDVKVFGILLSS